MSDNRSPLKRRVAPSIPLKLSSRDDAGAEVSLELRLCLDADALCALEEKVPSLNTLAMGGLAIFGRMSMTVLRATLWAAVLRHHPEYAGKDGLEAIGSYVDLGNSPDVVKALEDAYLATLSKERAEEIRRLSEAGEADQDPTKAAVPAANSTGETSGPSDGTTSDSAIAKSAA